MQIQMQDAINTYVDKISSDSDVLQIYLLVRVHMVNHMKEAI